MPPDYVYRAYTVAGARESGTLSASSEAEALDQLKRSGLVPVSLESGGSDEKPWWQRDVRFRSATLSARDTARLAETLSALLRAGLPLTDALRTVKASVPKTAHKGIETFREALIAGNSLATAAATLDGTVPSSLIDLLALGDDANRLGPILEKAASLHRRRAALVDKLTSALIYPAILVLAAVVLFGVLVLFLAPALRPLFETADTTPTGTLALLFSIEAAVRAVGIWPWAVAPVILGAGALAASQVGLFRWLASVARALPLVGPVLRATDTALATRALSLLIESGMPVQRALRTVGHTTPGPLGKSLKEAAYRAEQGHPIAEGLRGTDLPAALLELFAAAEASNQWPKILLDAAALFEADAARGQERLMELLTPALTLVVGVSVGAVMLSVIGAILEVNEVAF